eukprot:9328665-Ditylum_brightwellii.AAC.1
MDSVTMDTHPSRSYYVLPTENMEDAVSVYNTILSGQMVMEEDNTNLAIEIVEEDNVDNSWKAPPHS